MPKSDEFLFNYYVELHSNMRIRIQVEIKLLQIALALCGVVLTAIGVLYKQISMPGPFFALTILVATLLSVLAYIIGQKINHDHNVYESIGGMVEDVQEYFGMYKRGRYLTSKKLIKRKPLHGTGRGHKGSLAILTISTVFTAATIFVLGIIKLVVN